MSSVIASAGELVDLDSTETDIGKLYRPLAVTGLLLYCYLGWQM